MIGADVERASLRLLLSIQHSHLVSKVHGQRESTELHWHPDEGMGLRCSPRLRVQLKLLSQRRSTFIRCAPVKDTNWRDSSLLIRGPHTRSGVPVITMERRCNDSSSLLRV